MRKSKIKGIVKLCILLAPFLYTLMLAITRNENISSTMLSFMNEWSETFVGMNIFNDIYLWLDSTFFDSGSSYIFTIVMGYIFYWIFIEIIFIFKDVLCFLLEVASKWLERGIND